MLLVPCPLTSVVAVIGALADAREADESSAELCHVVRLPPAPRRYAGRCRFPTDSEWRREADNSCGVPPPPVAVDAEAWREGLIRPSSCSCAIAMSRPGCSAEREWVGPVAIAGVTRLEVSPTSVSDSDSAEEDTLPLDEAERRCCLVARRRSSSVGVERPGFPAALGVAWRSVSGRADVGEERGAGEGERETTAAAMLLEALAASVSDGRRVCTGDSRDGGAAMLGGWPSAEAGLTTSDAWRASHGTALGAGTVCRS